MSRKPKKKSEQWDSIAVITVMSKGTHLTITSEGCGAAGELADHIVALSGSVIDASFKEAKVGISPDVLGATSQQIALGIGGGK